MKLEAFTVLDPLINAPLWRGRPMMSILPRLNTMRRETKRETPYDREVEWGRVND